MKTRKPYPRKQFAPATSVYIKSLLDGWRRKNLFADLQAFCIFLGYPRSGHSLIGSFLNAHPDMVMAHELDALYFLQRGYSRNQIYSLLLDRDRWFASLDYRWEGYSYQVPNQWQGRFRRLLVIGDKMGGRNSILLHQDPDLLSQLKREIQIPLRILHIVRNPFDNIATMALKTDGDLEKSMQFYFSICCRTIYTQQEKCGDDEFLTLRLETFIAEPEQSLGQICRFLGIEAPAGYLADCASIVFASPNQSRTKVEWPADLRQKIGRKISQFPFLNGYTFEL